MNKSIKQQKNNERKRARIRAKIFGTAKCPRLSVFRSAKHVRVQLIDDDTSKTLVSASDKDLGKEKGNKTEIAFKVGELIAKKAKDKKIEKIVFDRAVYKYHGRIKSLAEGARKGGLKF